MLNTKYSLTSNAAQLYLQTGERLAADFEKFEQSNYRDHFKRSQEEIAQAIQGLDQTAIIFGAGALNDIPVQSLAERFDRIILVDINLSITEAALRRFPATVQSKFTITAADLTGILGELTAKVEEIAKKELPYDQFVAQVMDLLPTLERQNFDPQGSFSFVSSSMLASQLGGHLSFYLDKVTEAKYGKPFTAPEERKNQLEEFILEIQLKHIDDLHRLVAETGKVYFSDHFTSRNIIKISLAGFEKTVSGDPAPFPRTTEINAHLQHRFNTLKQENWTWSLRTSAHTEPALVVNDNKLEYMPFRQEKISEYYITSLSLKK